MLPEITEAYAVIISALITAIFTFAIAGWNEKQKRKRLERENRQVKAEMDLTRTAMSFSKIIGEWGNTYAEIVKLLESSPIDRFLVLRAWNGISSPKWTTAVLQIRSSGQEPVQYIHFELDDDYRTRLKETENNNLVQYKVSEMMPCAIKDVYDSEGVKSCAWGFVVKTEYAEGLYAIDYISFASHEVEEIDQATMTRCRLILDRLKGTANLLDDKNSPV